MVPTPPSRSQSASSARAASGPRVFISHSSKNQQIATAVVAELESQGIRCWISSRDIRPGTPNYGSAIIDGLSVCQAVVLLLTEASSNSQHVMKEAERAVNKNIPILVVKFQPVDVSKDLEYYVSSAQFLDATAPPLQQHFRTIHRHVREMLMAARRGSTRASVRGSAAIRPRGWQSGWIPFVAAIAVVGAAASAAVALLVVPALEGTRSTPPRPVVPAAAGPAPQSLVVQDLEPRAAEQLERPSPPAAQQPTSPTAGSSLLDGIEAKSRLTGHLATFAKTKLANFHHESLLLSRVGPLKPGAVSDTDAEIMASCRIEPNLEGYTALAREFILLLDKTAQQEGTLTSDGLRTSEHFGRDARPHIEKIRRESLLSSDGLLEIFASDTHQTLVQQHAAAGQLSYAAFQNVFLIYDENLKVRADNGRMMTSTDMAGIQNLRWYQWSSLLRQEGSGIVLLLESVKSSFRHTTWRWFHLSPSDWTTVRSHIPVQFRCVFTIVGPSGGKIESDYYPLRQYGVSQIDDHVLVLAPFFVNEDVEYYIPEVTLTKSVLLVRDDVAPNVDFTVTLEEERGSER